MSSLRNAVKRRTHKERSQPAERKRYGLLEKHKDYVLRARDFHRKDDTLKRLKEKAALRNPDEFYFRMEYARTRGGVHLQPTRGSKQWTSDELALMRSQDSKYILTKLQAERRKIEKLEASLHGISHSGPGTAAGTEAGAAEQQGKKKGRSRLAWSIGEDGEILDREDAEEEEDVEEGEEDGREVVGASCTSHHVVFFHDGEGDGEVGVSAQSAGFASVGDGSSKAAGQTAGPGWGATLEQGSGKQERHISADAPDSAEKQLSERRIASSYRELEQRKERAARLAAVLQELELQKALMGKGRKRKIQVEDSQGETKVVYKWAKQRQK